MKCRTEEKAKKRFAVTAITLVMLTVLMTGCAGSSSTHKETVTNPDAQTTVIREENTSKTVEHSHPGVLGSTFHVIGEIIAFPFEVIANVFRFIF